MPARKRSRPTLRERGVKGVAEWALACPATLDDDGRFVEYEWADHQEGERFRRAQAISDRRAMMRAHTIEEEP